MKTYEEMIALQARKRFEHYENSGSFNIFNCAAVIGYIYGVLECDVEVDIEEKFIEIVKTARGVK